MNCKIIQEPCSLKPQGLDASCFSVCPYAKGFLEDYNLTYIDAWDVSWYLEDLLEDEKNENKKFYLGQVLKLLEERRR